MNNTLHTIKGIAKILFRKNEYDLKEYVLRDGKKHPFAVICPGGSYFAVCDLWEGEPYARKLNEHGISAFVVYYRCRKKAAFPNPQDDLAHAVRSILERAEELNLDAGNYSVWGSSAGGHLAATFGLKEIGYMHYHLPRPGAIILAYPVISMGDIAHKQSREFLLGKAPQKDLILKTSPEHSLDKDYPDTFLWCGDSDTVVDPANSYSMDAALTVAGVRHRFVQYQGVGHGVGLGTGHSCEGWADAAIKFWMNDTKQNN